MKTLNTSKKSHCLPFHQHTLPEGEKPCWRRIGGYIVATDGKKFGYIYPKYVFAVDVVNGVPVLKSYWVKGNEVGLKQTRPYSFTYMRNIIHNTNRLVCTNEDYSFNKLRYALKKEIPDIYVPSKKEWCAEFGVK